MKTNKHLFEIAIESGMTQYVSAHNKFLERYAYMLLEEVYKTMNDIENQIKEDHPYIKSEVVKTECHIDLLKKHFALETYETDI